ncbi:iron-containing redox enzyme family protein [Paracidovorax anthurii]|uniref:Heme oxygenase-like protein n=1 Tax=Paracidovorax anthurii TaxID=78229 RepID=A0A328Y9Y3_9BURK|nr:iron-containing redox enzyme family protein [Paracidovorax anthurii]RAR70729.1 heme oxygenase-like protein [Paracidovorax anthurii]
MKSDTQDSKIGYGEFCAQVLHLEADFERLESVARAYIEDVHQGTEWIGSSLQLSIGNGLDHWHESARLLCESAQGPDKPQVDHAESLRILKRYAPLGLLPGCVLQNMANSAIGHLPLAAHAHAAHAQLVGSGAHTYHPARQFRHLLEQAGLPLPALTSTLFGQQVDVPVASWRLPSYWLGLSLFPEQRAPEILGAAYCECLYGIPGLARAAQQHLAPEHPAFADLQRRQQATLPSLQAALQELLRDDIDGASAKQVITGFIASIRLMQEWEQDCRADLQQGREQPARAMVELVRNKARFAVGYHGKLKLARQPLDELIVQDAESFVEELGVSRWVKPGRPEDSLLLTRLLAFGGPMFRVFSEQEEAVIRNWISTLTPQKPAHAAPAKIETRPSIPAMLTMAPPFPPPAAAPLGVRDLYHQLVNVERHPQIRHGAAAFCNSWLARSTHGIFKDDNALPFAEYSHSALREWFEARARDQVQSYTDTVDADDSEKSRECVIDEALQLCPMIFIDGAWLQRWSNAGLVDTPIGALLFKIFSDEIGNGDIALNHPNIYRALMQQMEIDLPDFRSREFAHFPRFKDAAFEVPAFWLSISLFPQRYLAETLGLNLAMELSGVGGAYRTARDELRQHGFSTLFVDLHNTIDNVSTGHSAMALEAIQLWMDQALSGGDPQQIRTAWLRVWTGFRALAAPPRHWREWLRPARYPH